MAYTTINDPTDYFNTNLWTSSASELNVTGVGFQPDFVWLKSRSIGADHGLWDNVRGVQKLLASNQQDAESTTSGLTSFDSDGFTLGTANSNFNGVAGRTMVGWNWLASNTTASNTDGSITSTVSANTTSGFSIVSYTGTGSAGTVGHGLNNAPEMIILKRRDGGSGNTNWFVGHKDLTSWGYRVFLNATLAEGADSDFLANTAPTSNHFSVSTDISTNGSSGSQLAYCFHSVKGFSKIGSYTGNGSTDGTFVYTGFKPAWVMIKNTNVSNNWVMHDNKRKTFNPNGTYFYPNSSSAEVNYDPYSIDLLSNGFKTRNNNDQWNSSGNTFIYMAFAESPFTTSTGVPTTAR